MVLRSLVIVGAAFVLLAGLLLLARCAGVGLGQKKDESAQIADLSRPDTPENRAVQVAWTAARARHCLFRVDREKLRSEYLAYERARGAPAESLQELERTYDVTFRTFMEKVGGVPNYCTPKRMAEIRPDINRHLRGDYSPSPRKPPKPQQEDLPPLSDEETLPDVWKDDRAQHKEP